MKGQARYFVILIFFLVVISAMFFIYSTVNSAEKIIYYKGEPTIFNKMNCILKGGKIEVMPSGGGAPCLELLVDEKDECEEKNIYRCHYK